MGQRFNRFDEVTPCHPTPIYELIFAVGAFVFLWGKRKKYEAEAGKLFGLTIIFMGIERLLVEFLRINPLYYTLSMAQWISIALIMYGFYLFYIRKPRGTASSTIHN